VAIELKCECGATCPAEESQLGQTIKCPACGKDMPVAAPDGFVAEVLAEGPSAMHDLQATVGKGDVNEMIAQITGVRPTEGAPAPTAASKPASVASPAMTELTGSVPAPSAGLAGPPPAVRTPSTVPSPQAAEKPRRRPPKGLDRAKHHLGFKKIMWRVALLVGLGCVVLAVYCLMPKTLKALGAPMSPTLSGEKYTNEETGQTVELYTGDAGESLFLCADSAGHYWWIPKGARENPQSNGKMYYFFKGADGKEGEDEIAQSADGWFKHEGDIRNQKVEQQVLMSQYRLFGFGFAAVGGILLVLGLWMWYDVQLVRRAAEPTEPTEEAKDPKTADAASQKGADPSDV
jgi:hypothetical protein